MDPRARGLPALTVGAGRARPSYTSRVRDRGPLLALGLTIASCAAPAPAVEVPVVAVPVAPTGEAGGRGSVPIATPLPESAKPASLAAALRAHLRTHVASIDSQDGALFRRGLEREEADDPAGARNAYLELIKNTPASPLVPYAYVAFGDLFFREAEQDAPDRWALAQQVYQKVVTYPPPQNVVFAYAWQRLGETFNRTGEFARALDASRKAILAVASNRELPLGQETAEAARRELVVAYAGAGQPDKALAFFRSTDVENTPAMVLLLGEEYVRTAHPREAVALYTSALNAGKSPALCAAAEQAARELQLNADTPTNRILFQLEARRRSICGP
jgi:tetratricopeptide (TPR) repeat protein